MTGAAKPIKAKTVDEYIAGFPGNIQQMLQDIRLTIKKAAPEAREAIKYDIPTFTLNGNMVSFGAWKNHIGFYPVPREAEEFKTALSRYKGTKSTVQFPFNEPLPLALIGKLVKYLARKNLEKAAAKK